MNDDARFLPDEPDSDSDDAPHASSDPNEGGAPRGDEQLHLPDDESSAAEGELPNSATLPGDHADLVRRAQAGDRSALEELIQKFMSFVFAIAMRVLRNRQDAEDVVQLVMLNVARKIGQVDEPEKFPGWIGTCAQRAALAFRRKKALEPRTVALHDNIPGRAVAMPGDFYDLVRRFPAKSELTRDCIRAWAEGLLMGETKPEIARRLGVHVNRIRSAVWAFQRWVQGDDGAADLDA